MLRSPISYAESSAEVSSNGLIVRKKRVQSIDAQPFLHPGRIEACLECFESLALVIFMTCPKNSGSQTERGKPPHEDPLVAAPSRTKRATRPAPKDPAKPHVASLPFRYLW